MEAIHLHAVVEKDGEIVVTGLPYKKGEAVKVILFPRSRTKPRKRSMTAGELRHSKIVGLWKDRTDIQDSAVFARELRWKAEHRQG